MENKRVHFTGMDIWLSWMQDMVMADRIFSALEPFEAKRILMEAGSIGKYRLPTRDQPEYFAWLSSLAEIVCDRHHKDECLRAGIKQLPHAPYGEWIRYI